MVPSSGRSLAGRPNRADLSVSDRAWTLLNISQQDIYSALLITCDWLCRSFLKRALSSTGVAVDSPRRNTTA